MPHHSNTDNKRLNRSPQTDNSIQHTVGNAAKDTSDQPGFLPKASEKNSGAESEGDTLTVLILKQKERKVLAAA
jgi:hypothetical protein